MGSGPTFRDRTDAGRRLAERLVRYADQKPVILGLPRGGVPVAAEVARRLNAPLDVFVSRKLGAPDQPELGIGAVAEGGVRILNARIVEHLGISEGYLDLSTRRELAEVERRVRLLRGEGRPGPQVRGRTAILVDDGLATGVTARAAILALRQRGPRRLVLAVPVCPIQTAQLLAPEVDDFVCLKVPEDFVAVGHWYRDFDQTTDRQVMEILAQARREGDA